MTFVISEGIEGTWHYHLSNEGTPTVSLCGKRTMPTRIPNKSWGKRSHLNEHWCRACPEIAAESQVAGGGGGVDTD